ncbi:kinase-like domain-containing protein [Ustulina deusta]|nr:kinase-like domain-containing protein [Ustulina deusta]
MDPSCALVGSRSENEALEGAPLTALASQSPQKGKNEFSSLELEIGGIRVDLLHDRLEDKVGNILRTKCCGSGDSTSSFFPRCALQDILSYRVVKYTLRQKLCTLQESDQIAEKVLGYKGNASYIQIFATLLLISKVKYIQYFVRENICDENLPLVCCDNLFTRLNPCKSGHIDTFCRLQWEVIVPVFDFSLDEIPIETYESETRLPFVKCKDTSEGGHGKIIEVEIHQSHLKGQPPDHQNFAIKRFEFTGNGYNMWQDDISALQRLSAPKTRHEHLINLFLAYKHQCFGITDALKTLHGNNSEPGNDLGRHGDIKPENILWFKQPADDRGQLKVADFTLARFHSPETVNVTAPGNRGFTRTYRPPEVDLERSKRLAQNYDVWCLGCVFLEFVTWYLLGYDATRNKFFLNDCGQKRQSFVEVRVNDDHYYNGTLEDKFFNICYGNNVVPHVKESVKKWISFLRGDLHCSKDMYALLDVVEEWMLAIDPEARWSMTLVEEALDKIAHGRYDTKCYQSGAPPFNRNNEFPPIYDEKCSPWSYTSNSHPIARSTHSSAPNNDRDETRQAMRQLEELFEDEIEASGIAVEEENQSPRSSTLPSRDPKDSNDQPMPATTTYSFADSVAIESHGTRDSKNSLSNGQAGLQLASEGIDVGLEIGFFSFWWIILGMLF